MRTQTNLQDVYNYYVKKQQDASEDNVYSDKLYLTEVAMPGCKPDRVNPYEYDPSTANIS